jgi:hypothetical protein
MQKILVDGGEFHRQGLVQVLDDFLFAFHAALLIVGKPASYRWLDDGLAKGRYGITRILGMAARKSSCRSA